MINKPSYLHLCSFFQCEPGIGLAFESREYEWPEIGVRGLFNKAAEKGSTILDTGRSITNRISDEGFVGTAKDVDDVGAGATKARPDAPIIRNKYPAELFIKEMYTEIVLVHVK